MSIWKSVIGEYRFNFGQLKQLIPIIAIMFIPIMYAGTYLWSFWDPYGNTSRLPVAVVNDDIGAMGQGKHINVGQQLVDNLKTNTNFKWDFVSGSVATNGMNSNKYVMELKIPSNFSEQTIQSAGSANAAKPQIVSITNDRYNYVASLIGKNAAESVKEQTAQNIAKSYATTLVTGIQQLEQGLKGAAGGAQKISTGADELSSKTGVLASGAENVATGSTTLYNAMNQAVAGASQVSSGTNRVYEGSLKLNQGLTQLVTQGSALREGANKTSVALNQLRDGLTQSQSGANQTSAAAAKVASGLAGLEASDPTLANNSQFQSLVQASQQVALGTQKLATSQTSLLSGATQLADGQNEFAGGLNQFIGGVSTAQKGSQSLVVAEPPLVNGAKKVATGLSTLKSGAGQLNAGITELNKGLDQFSAGASALKQGANHMNSSLRAATLQMPSMNRTQMISATENPVLLSRVHQGNVPNYGYGLAPYFISLGMFVGSLLMSIVIHFRDPAREPQSGVAWFISKAILLLSVGVAQSFVLDAIILMGLGIHVPNVADFIGFTLLTSFAFLAIIQFLVTVFANPGRFLVIIVLILQLTSTAGTFPVSLSPQFFQYVSPFVPMTYTVEGFRYLMYGGNLGFMHKDILVLSLFGVSFMVLSFTYFVFRFRRAEFHDNKEQSATLLRETAKA